ncbi:unnamed protein product [Ceratitis capitata]|uniref:(Mediterranean fruit fly) hypothetical protein n=1 Tax=Ceratitis capitata TaxID=7213 RepID=A0A811UJU1_CERCA|nr:unnamed protein product [Ceratitis capitata]
MCIYTLTNIRIQIYRCPLPANQRLLQLANNNTLAAERMHYVINSNACCLYTHEKMLNPAARTSRLTGWPAGWAVKEILLQCGLLQKCKNSCISFTAAAAAAACRSNNNSNNSVIRLEENADDSNA